MDFTLSRYQEIIRTALKYGYNIGTVSELFENKLDAPFVILRHDVDRRPKNALRMAQVESQLGVRASYYFRSVQESFQPDIIQNISHLEHEIGYHYEDWYLAKYNKDKAKELFERNLKRLDSLSKVRTICMHGSPLSRENNMSIWDHWDFRDYGLKDCILSQDYTGFAFFTDSGRTFGISSANLRDELGNATLYPSVKTSKDICAFLGERQNKRIMISVHPERWSNNPLIWTHQLSKDLAINAIKRGIRLLRKGTS